VRLLSPYEVTVDMGVPAFEPARVPFRADGEADSYAIDVGEQTLQIGAVSMGNPHAVTVVPDLSAPTLFRWGPLLSTHQRFPEGANAGFVQVINREQLRLRVHERGSGWTLACGTGACAAMAVMRRRGEVADRVRVNLPGGELTIDWAGPGHTLWMSGPASFVFEGEWLGSGPAR
jgi:diaminopimelate epimerase